MAEIKDKSPTGSEITAEKFKHYEENTGEYIETGFHHFELPEDLDNPVIDGVERTMNLGITRSPGWHYANQGMLFIPAYRKVMGQSLSFKLTNLNDEGKPVKTGLFFEFGNTRSFSKRISVIDVFNILFGISDADQVRALVGTTSPLLTSEYMKPKTGVDLLRAIKHQDITNTADLTHKLRTMLTTQTLIDAPERIYDMFSLTNFEGCSLAEEVVVGQQYYPKFTILDPQLIFRIEHSGLESVKLLTADNERIDISIPTGLYCKIVEEEIEPSDYDSFYSMERMDNQFTFNGKTYSKRGVPKHNTLEVYCAIINRMLAFRVMGTEFSMQDYNNQKIVTFADKIDDFRREDLESVYGKIAITGTLLEGVSGTRFDVSRALKLIKNADSALAVISKNENPIALTSNGKVLVRDVTHLAREAVQVASQDLGITDPVDSAESKNIGKATPFTLTTVLDRENGSLAMPLYKVVDGKVTKEVEMVHVGRVPSLFIAQEGDKLEGNVLAKHNGEVKLFPSSVVTHVRVSPFSTTSVCRATSAFLENTDQKRTQMTANAQKQARTILRPKRALVETGIEAITANGDTGIKHKFNVREIFADAGVTANLDGHRFEIEQIADTGMVKEYRLVSTTEPSLFAIFYVKSEKSSYGSSYYYELVAPADKEDTYLPYHVVYKQHNIILEGKVEGSDRLDYHTEGDSDYFVPTVANGQDLLVMFGFHEAFTVDDASAISDRLVRDMSYASPVLVTKTFQKDKIFDKDLEEHFGKVNGSTPNGYTSDGLPMVGKYLNPGSEWLYKYVYDTVNSKAIDKTLRLSDSEQGEVISVSNDKEEIKITIAKWIHVEVGDKLSARHGNKTIVARVVPAEMMPFDPKTGKRVDMIINPLGIPSRGNISQLAEIQKSAEVKASGLDSKVVPPFSNELYKMVENYEQGKELTEIQLVNPQTGQYYPQKHFCGYMHYLRSVHIAEDKYHGIGDSSEIDVAFMQPVGGSELHEKGQSISSMEKEILVSYGASGILDEIHSVLSADRAGFRAISEYFEENPDSPAVEVEGSNLQAEHMQHAALAFHVHLDQQGDKIHMDYLSDEAMESFVEVDMRQVDFYLTDRKFLNTMLYIPLPKPIITPVAVRKFKFASIVKLTNFSYQGAKSYGSLGHSSIEGIIKETTVFTVTDVAGSVAPSVALFPHDIDEVVLEKIGLKGATQYTGMADLIQFLRDYPMQVWIDEIYRKSPNFTNDAGVFSEPLMKLVKRAEALNANGGFEHFITTRFPVLPNKYRQAKNDLNSKDSFSAAYKDITKLAKDLERSNQVYPRLYKRLGELMLPSKTGSTRISLFEFFAKKDVGGRIRSKILKTRVLCSMRATIVPMFAGDPKRFGYPAFAGHPDSIGLPLIGALRIAQPRVLGYLLKHHPTIMPYGDDVTDIDRLSHVIDIITLPLGSVAKLTGWDYTEVSKRVKSLKKELIDFVNGSHVFYGRAPSLHETSLRGGMIYVHEEKVIHLHSLLTTDLNADHDGDQLYVVMPVTAEAISDIKDKLLPSTNALRYNEGTPSLLISQDAMLGLHFATAPAVSDKVRVMASVEQIHYHLNLGTLQYNDLVVLSIKTGDIVKATAGRIVMHDIMFNLASRSPLKDLTEPEDGFCTVKFDKQIMKDKPGINVIDVQKAIAEKFAGKNLKITDIYTALQNFGYEAVERRNLTVGIKDLTPVLEVESINKEIKGYVESARTFEELGLLPEDYLINMDMKVSELVKKLDIYSKVPEDNAFKILAVSGAKGNKGGIERMFGVVGFINGNNDQRLTTPVLSNTVRGLTQFQVEDLSYTQRDNAISTVFETSKPGETLRSGAFELSGLIIQPNTEEEIAQQLCLYVKKSNRMWLGTARKNAKLILNGEVPKLGKEDVTYTYKGKELDEDLLRQIGNSPNSEVLLDDGKTYVFLEVKLHPFASEYLQNKIGLDGKVVTKAKLTNMLIGYPKYIPLASHTNEFSTTFGVSQKHAGTRIGSGVPYELEENVGIKASTATSQPANQLVISKRNMSRSGDLDNGIDLFKAAIQSAKFFKGDPKSYCMLCPENGTIRITIIDSGTIFNLQAESGDTHTHFLPAEDEHLFDIDVKDGDLVFLGQSIMTPKGSNPADRPVSPVNSFRWTQVETVVQQGPKLMPMPVVFKDSLINPSTELVQLVRFYFMIYLNSIYKASGINLDPNHYGAFALQSSRFCTTLTVDWKGADEHEHGYLNLNTYFTKIKDKYKNTVVKFDLTKGSETIMLTAGPIAALCYRDAISVASKASALGHLPEFGSLSKVALGVGLRESIGDKVVLKEQVSERQRTNIKLDRETEAAKYEFVQEEEADDVFGGFGWDGADESPEGGTEEFNWGEEEEIAEPVNLDEEDVIDIEEIEIELEEEVEVEVEVQSQTTLLNQSSIFGGGNNNADS